MAEDSFDLANVKALLSSGNPIIQSNGLTCLLSRLRLPFPNAKEKVSASSLFFDGFTKCFPALKMLLVSRILSEELDINILHHIYINADSDDLHIGQLLEYLPWKFSRHFITKFKLRHIVANLLSHCAELSHRELQSVELSVEDVFLLAENVLVNPLLVMNELFPACHVLLPALLSLYSSRSELAKSFPSLIPSEQLSKIKAVIAHCQKVRPLKTVVLEDDWSGCMSTFTYLEYVSNASNITTFTDLWLSNLDSTEVSLSSITFSTALLPYCKSSFKKCSTLLIGLLNRSPEHHGEERDIAFSLIQDLVTKFPTTFDAVKNLAIPGESDCLDLLKLKLKLMSTLCVSTDRSDELLPSLTRLLKKSADVVGAAVSAVIVLCKEEILDINSVRKQLGIMVRQPGFEVALMGYCEILAAAATQSEKCDDSVSVEYVQELWEITQLRKDSSDGEDARRRAWTALGSFDFHLLESAIPISGRRLVGQFLGLRQTERKGITYCVGEIFAFISYRKRESYSDLIFFFLFRLRINFVQLTQNDVVLYTVNCFLVVKISTRFTEDLSKVRPLNCNSVFFAKKRLLFVNGGECDLVEMANSIAFGLYLINSQLAVR
uniref:MMS19 nucleotide excision repair protein n=1 Tax=Angiostrongylus cantonensis TaxID=6313 RepID=A0A0K0DGU4_ANGCA